MWCPSLSRRGSAPRCGRPDPCVASGSLISRRWARRKAINRRNSPFRHQIGLTTRGAILLYWIVVRVGEKTPHFSSTRWLDPFPGRAFSMSVGHVAPAGALLFCPSLCPQSAPLLPNQRWGRKRGAPIACRPPFPPCFRQGTNPSWAPSCTPCPYVFSQRTRRRTGVVFSGGIAARHVAATAESTPRRV
mgnify:CR=1 FL=1